MRATCPVNFILVDMVTSIQVLKLLIVQFCLTSDYTPLADPHIFLCTSFSNTLGLPSYFHVTVKLDTQTNSSHNYNFTQHI